MAGAALYHGEELLAYRFHPDHPLNPLRLELTMTLIEQCNLLWPGALRSPRPASRTELSWVHRPDYIDAVERLSRAGSGWAWTYGLGDGDNPVFAGMHEAAALVAGTSLLAAKDILAGDVTCAVHLAGGLHHAMPGRASGFCIYNDAALAICFFRRQGLRVAYVDLDAHHGDGVEAIFQDDPDVLTISLHESGRYLFPGTGDGSDRGRGAGYGYSVNVPLHPGTGDESWWACFESVVPRLLRAYRPDVLVSQHGCDAHRLDPLSHLMLTSRPLVEAARVLRSMAEEFCSGRWLVLGGGGYDIWRVVPTVWAQVWAIAAGLPLPTRVPEGWRSRWRARSPVPLPESFLDLSGSPLGDGEWLPYPAQEVEEANRLAVCRVLEGIPWLAG